MLNLKINNITAKLPDKTSVRIIRKNFMLERNSEFSLPIQLPLSVNRSIFGFPERPGFPGTRAKSLDFNLSANGMFVTSGKANVTGIENENIEVTLKGSLPILLSEIKNKTLADLTGWPTETGLVNKTTLQLNDILNASLVQDAKNYIGFPIYNYAGSGHYINHYSPNLDSFDVPQTYCPAVLVQFRYHYILRTVWSVLGYAVTENYFDSTPELRNITVFNAMNIKGLTGSELKLLAFVPGKMLVSDFLFSVLGFGAVFDVDSHQRTVRIFYGGTSAQVKPLTVTDKWEFDPAGYDGYDISFTQPSGTDQYATSETGKYEDEIVVSGTFASKSAFPAASSSWKDGYLIASDNQLLYKCDGSKWTAVAGRYLNKRTGITRIDIKAPIYPLLNMYDAGDVPFMPAVEIEDLVDYWGNDKDLRLTIFRGIAANGIYHYPFANYLAEWGDHSPVPGNTLNIVPQNIYDSLKEWIRTVANSYLVSTQIIGSSNFFRELEPLTLYNINGVNAVFSSMACKFDNLEGNRLYDVEFLVSIPF